MGANISILRVPIDPMGTSITRCLFFNLSSINRNLNFLTATWLGTLFFYDTALYQWAIGFRYFEDIQCLRNVGNRWCIDGVLMVYRWCIDGVLMVYRWCIDGVLMVY